MEIKACSRCGSCELTIPPQSLMDIRAVPSGIYYCRDCGNIGLPVVFDDLAKYEEFLKTKE